MTFKKGNIAWNKGIPRSKKEKINISNSLKGKPSLNEDDINNEIILLNKIGELSR
jgi:hypothetical protein